MSDEREAALRDCAAWHRGEAARHLRAQAKAREWSAEHNDGDPSLGGTYAEVEVPRLVEVHQKSARHFERSANKIRRAALAALASRAPTQESEPE